MPSISIIITLAIFLLLMVFLTYRGIARIRRREVVINERIRVKWWVIGLSLFAADVSLNYIILTANKGFEKGLAVGSYGWTASLIIIVVALYILPRFMRLGIVTLPEYLERRFSPNLRLFTAILFSSFIAFVALSSNYYSFAVLISKTLQVDVVWQVPVIMFVGLFSISLLFAGGMNTAMRFDMVSALLLLVGGAAVFIMSVYAAGGFSSLAGNAEGKLVSILPEDDNYLPWTQAFFGGLWLLHLNYWGFFQPMAQKMVQADSLSSAQKGLLLTATLKLIVPFMFLIPGIVCFELYADQVKNSDEVFPIILHNIFPVYLTSFMVIIFAVTVISVSYAYLHAAGIMMSKDIYLRFVNKAATEVQVEKAYFFSIILVVCCSVTVAPFILTNETVKNVSQDIRNTFLPGIIVMFLMGLFVPRSYAPHAWGALAASFLLYLVDKIYFPEWLTVRVLGVNFMVIVALMFFYVSFMPSARPIKLLGQRDIRFERNLIVVVWSIFIVAIVCSIYVVFL